MDSSPADVSIWSIARCLVPYGFRDLLARRDMLYCTHGKIYQLVLLLFFSKNNIYWAIYVLVSYLK
jgi:hypothetical protein